MYTQEDVVREIAGLLDRAVRFDALARKNGHTTANLFVTKMMDVAAEAERLLAVSPEKAGDFLHRNGYTPVPYVRR